MYLSMPSIFVQALIADSTSTNGMPGETCSKALFNSKFNHSGPLP